ncbi:TadG family pilus assembly protein [Variovorax sp. EBFNA2]|uniref:TadG family pilus assembly protein n=1 Tax=Variovorax sp. EBFNA2 TaxID=3342097 RepID=UPI0029C08B97|nr:TadG family pilus assembly protein [Variovorax boronicumulans]WPG36901.1 TadG family pilus assembly protein [Variovorax boronicumulans]
MNTTPTRPIRSRARRLARGSIVINTAIALSLIVITLVGAELGYQFYLKRELQKTADLAALAGAQKLGPPGGSSACASAELAARANAVKNFAGIVLTEAICGHWDPTKVTPVSTDCFAGTDDHFSPLASPENAFRVRIKPPPSTLLPFFTGNRTICVQAVATQRQPLASLTIRSTLAEINSEKSVLLDAILGSMLGSKLSVRAGGWQGLLDADVQLLSVFDQLKLLDANLSLLSYDQLLGTEIDAGLLLQAMINAMQRGGETTDIAIGALGDILLSVKAAPFNLKLQEFLSIATGTEAAGLQTNLQIFQLVQGAIQIANGKNSLAAEIPIKIDGLANFNVKVRATEPPQISAIRNPALINPNKISDPNNIQVQTAQVRALISINLSGLNNIISKITGLVGPALGAITDLLKSITSLNLGNLVASIENILSQLLGCGHFLAPACQPMKVIYTEVLADPIRIGIKAGNGSALVTGFTCPSGGEKSLTADAKTSITRLNVGSMEESDFFTAAEPIAAPISILEIGYREVKYDSCPLLPVLGAKCDGEKWRNNAGVFVSDPSAAKITVIAGIGLNINSNIGSSFKPLTYSTPSGENLPEIDAAPYSGPAPDPSYQELSAKSVIESLSSTLSGIHLHTYYSTGSGPLGPLLEVTSSLVNSLLGSLESLLSGELVKLLLDPLTNNLLELLGINLAQTEVGARLSCDKGATLVY